MAGPLFRALARPQMVAGVTYPFFVLNGIIAAELFLIFKSPFALLSSLVNVTNRGRVAVVQQLGGRFTLRLGKRVATVTAASARTAR